MLRLVIILVIIVVVGGTVYASFADPTKLPQPIQPFAPKIKDVLSIGIGGAQTALSKTESLQPAVMGATTQSSRIFQEDTSEKPIHQQAMEFTQYEYCKMIVQSYEAANEKKPENSPTASPTPEKIE